MQFDLRGTIEQQAADMMKGPVQVQCTSLPAVNGTYAIDAAAQVQINAIVASINAGQGLPSGQSTFAFPDTSGNRIMWPQQPFVDFAGALRRFLYDAEQVALGHTTTLPSSMTLTIP
jgi:hypothetical protein